MWAQDLANTTTGRNNVSQYSSISFVFDLSMWHPCTHYKKIYEYILRLQTTISPSPFYPQWSGLESALPANIHLLTLEQFYTGGPVACGRGPCVAYLLRLEHFYEVGEDKELSAPVTLDLKVGPRS